MSDILFNVGSGRWACSFTLVGKATQEYNGSISRNCWIWLNSIEAWDLLGGCAVCVFSIIFNPLHAARRAMVAEGFYRNNLILS